MTLTFLNHLYKINSFFRTPAQSVVNLQLVFTRSRQHTFFDLFFSGGFKDERYLCMLSRTGALGIGRRTFLEYKAFRGSNFGDVKSKHSSSSSLSSAIIKRPTFQRDCIFISDPRTKESTSTLQPTFVNLPLRSFRVLRLRSSAPTVVLNISSLRPLPCSWKVFLGFSVNLFLSVALFGRRGHATICR
jgi:hypothetical protein